MTSPVDDLRALGEGLRDLRWVQGPGGNVSVKEDGELWVKASGKRLAEVADEGGHARLSIDLGLRALGGDEGADAELFRARPRPSLEAYFHAIGPRIVAHTHAVGALLYACSAAAEADGPAPGLMSDHAATARSIPYVRPGRGVAVAVRDALPPSYDEAVVVLRSHGIIAYAATAERAIELTVDFDRRARAPFGDREPIDDVVARYREAAEVAFAGGVVRPLPSRKIALAGLRPRYLFPDAVVCATQIPIATLDDPPAQAARAFAEIGRAGVLVDREGRRAAFAKSSAQLDQTIEVLAAHDWVEGALSARSTAWGAARYLPGDEPAELLGLPSEQYRIQLAARLEGRTP